MSRVVCIAEHTVDLDLLPKQANILDLGCRGFAFTRAMRELGHHVWPVDIDELHEDQAYYQIAITDFDGLCGIQRTNDKQATHIKKIGDAVNAYRLSTFSEKAGVQMWDLIKMDIEGSEHEVIMDLKTAPAKQLSIEFHLHTGVYDRIKMEKMEQKLAFMGYHAMSHEISSQHGAGYNYWDSLFVLGS